MRVAALLALAAVVAAQDPPVAPGDCQLTGIEADIRSVSLCLSLELFPWLLIPGEPETEGGESNVDDGEREADRPLAHRERKHRRTMWREATMQEPEGGGGSVRCSLPG